MPRGLIAAIACGVIALGFVFGASLWVVAGLAGMLTLLGARTMARTLADAAIIVRDTNHGGPSNRDSNDVDADRGAVGDRTVRSGSRVDVAVTVRNRSRLPMPWVLIEERKPRFVNQSPDVISPPIETEGDTVAVRLLMPDQTETLRYEVVCHRRGYVQIGPTTLETGDLLGLFRNYQLAGHPTFVTVLPKVHPIHSYELGSRRPIGEIRIRERAMEDPTRLRGIRQWQIGDPMRSVHWAATARTGTLHTKIYEPSSIIGATMVIDMHRDTNPPHNEPVRCDLAISAAASMASALLNQNEPFGLATNGRDAADRLRIESLRANGGTFADRASAKAQSATESANDRMRPVVMRPDKTAAHYHEMLATMARLERTDGLTLPQLLIECESRLPGDTTLIVLVQMADAAAIAALVGLHRRGRAVEVVINTDRDEDFGVIAGPLTAEKIGVHHLKSESVIPDLCRNLAVR